MTEKPRVLGVGEVLLDMLPTGEKLGGAPANFVFHCHQLGATTTLFSAIGKDTIGQKIKSEIEKASIPYLLQEKDGSPSSTVNVSLKNGIPEYIIHENVAWDHLQLSTEWKIAVQSCDALYFGTLAQRSKISSNTIFSLIDTAPSSAMIICDLNLRQDFFTQETLLRSLKKADVLKINDEELAVLSEMLSLTGSEKGKCRKLLNDFEISTLALTKGSEGSWLFTAEILSFLEAKSIKVIDTVGAGDSFTAAFAMGLLQNHPLEKIHLVANELAANVCRQEGAMVQHAM